MNYCDYGSLFYPGELVKVIGASGERWYIDEIEHPVGTIGIIVSRLDCDYQHVYNVRFKDKVFQHHAIYLELFKEDEL